MPQSPEIALRLDDVGACSKRYEVYSNHNWRWGPLRISANWLVFPKYITPYKNWGPYRELLPEEWHSVFDLLRRYRAKLTVGVTASWAKSESELIPFPVRCPVQAAVLREGLEEGLLEIANHGLTHCVLKNNAFKPKLFRSNQKFHREFWSWISDEIQEKHICRSQTILQNWFRTEIVTFVPPGNVFTDTTLEIARRFGLRYVSCHTNSRLYHDIVVIGNEHVLAFHDRELVMEGTQWLQHRLQEMTPRQFRTIRELAETSRTRLARCLKHGD